MDVGVERYDVLLCSAAKRLTGAEHRSFLVEVTQAVCDGNSRRAERRFGWGRETIEKGLHEQRTGNLGRYEGEGESRRILSRGEKAGLIPRAIRRRLGTTTRRRRRNWSPSAS